MASLYFCNFWGLCSPGFVANCFFNFCLVWLKNSNRVGFFCFLQNWGRNYAGAVSAILANFVTFSTSLGFSKRYDPKFSSFLLSLWRCSKMDLISWLLSEVRALQNWNFLICLGLELLKARAARNKGWDKWSAAL